MGWLTHDQYERLNTAGIRTYFEKAFNPCTIHYMSVQNFREVYMVLSRPEFPNERFAMVCLIINTPKEFGYKDMDETCGPNYYNAPKKLLEMLTPIESEWANQWRADCWNKIAAQARLKKGATFIYKDKLYGIKKATKSSVIASAGFYDQKFRTHHVMRLMSPLKA